MESLVFKSKGEAELRDKTTARMSNTVSEYFVCFLVGQVFVAVVVAVLIYTYFFFTFAPIPDELIKRKHAKYKQAIAHSGNEKKGNSASD